MSLRLVCFPPAGCSASVFRPWAASLGPDVVVEPCDLPGRGRGPVPEECPSLVDAAARYATRLAGRIAPDEPWALWGHSLGGLLAFETARRLCAAGHPGPRFVAVAGSRPPHRSLGDLFAPMLPWDDDALLDGLATVGAVNPTLRTSPMRGLFVPALRRDLRLLCGYPPPDATGGPLPVDLVAWHGGADTLAPPALAAEWARYTSARFVGQTFTGGHFFPLENTAATLPALKALAGSGLSTTGARG